MRTLFIGFLLIGVHALNVNAQRDVPPLDNHRVHDDAGVLSSSTVTYLEQALREFEDSTSNQIAILIFSSLEGESIDQFGIRVADAWKLGTQANDNGAILLVAVNDRKVRIEVGQGLEGPLPDAVCNRIIRNELAPAFRRGDYDSGVVSAIDAIRMAIKGEYKGTGPRKTRRGLPAGFVILLIIIILVMRRGNRGGRGGRWSAGTGFLIGSALGSMGRGGGGGWGGGGFSGGGGSFGGGGSSGSW